MPAVCSNGTGYNMTVQAFNNVFQKKKNTVCIGSGMDGGYNEISSWCVNIQCIPLSNIPVPDDPVLPPRCVRSITPLCAHKLVHALEREITIQSHCNTLQNTATRCNTLQLSVPLCANWGTRRFDFFDKSSTESVSASVLILYRVQRLLR